MKKEPAFPIQAACKAAAEGDDPALLRNVMGLTKREYFAAMTMQGLLSIEGIHPKYSSGESLCGTAVEAADALIKELGRED